MSFAPQHFSRSVARRAASHDDDVLWRRPGTGRLLLLRLRLGLLLAYEELAAACFNLPACDRVKRRRAKRLTGAKTETGVMPRATDGVAHRDTFGERSAIMCTDSTYSEVCIASPNYQDRLAVGVPLQHGAFGKLGERDSLRKVWSA